jgi:hypothetical protein
MWGSSECNIFVYIIMFTSEKVFVYIKAKVLPKKETQ